MRTQKVAARKVKNELELRTKQVNNLEKQLQRWIEENKVLRRDLNVDPEWGLDENKLDLRVNSELQEARAQVRVTLPRNWTPGCFSFVAHGMVSALVNPPPCGFEDRSRGKERVR